MSICLTCIHRIKNQKFFLTINTTVTLDGGQPLVGDTPFRSGESTGAG